LENFKKVNAWKLANKAFILITPQKVKVEEVKASLQEITVIVKAQKEYLEFFFSRKPSICCC
jgi:hypothetical protein